MDGLDTTGSRIVLVPAVAVDIFTLFAGIPELWIGRQRSSMLYAQHSLLGTSS